MNLKYIVKGSALYERYLVYHQYDIFLQDDVNVQFTYTSLNLPTNAASSPRNIKASSPAKEDVLKSILQTVVLSFGKFYLTLYFMIIFSLLRRGHPFIEVFQFY